MKPTTTPRPKPRLLRFAEGLDSLLSNFVGSADIGPYVRPDQELSARAPIDLECPSCGQPISGHERRRTATMGRLYCP